MKTVGVARTPDPGVPNRLDGDDDRRRPGTVPPAWTSSPAGVVSFYLPDQRSLNGRDPESLDCNRDWHVFGTGVYVWVLQTFVRLHHAGAPVRITASAPASGIVVTHSDYVERLLADAPSAGNLTIVSARADRRPQIYADIEIVQNQSSVRDFQIFIPSWLQPGLIARPPPEVEVRPVPAPTRVA